MTQLCLTLKGVEYCSEIPSGDYTGDIFNPSPPGGDGGGGQGGVGGTRGPDPRTGAGDWPVSTIDFYTQQSANLTQANLDARCAQFGAFWCPIADRRRGGGGGTSTPPPSTSGPQPIISNDASVPLTFAGLGAMNPFAAKPAPRRAPPRRAPMRRKPAPKKPTPRPRRPLPVKKPPLPEQPIRWLPKVAPKVLRVAGRAFGLLANLLWPSDLGDPERGYIYPPKRPPAPGTRSPQPVVNTRRDSLVESVLPEVTVYARRAIVPSSVGAYDPALAVVADPFAGLQFGSPAPSLATPALHVAQPSIRPQGRTQPVRSPLDSFLSGSSNLPRKVPKPASPLKPGFLELPAAQPTPKEELDRCRRSQQKKRSKRKQRTECYRGTYIESAKGLSKRRLEKISCQ